MAAIGRECGRSIGSVVRHDVACDVEGKRPLVAGGVGRRVHRLAIRRLSYGNSPKENRDGESTQRSRGCYPPREMVIATIAPPRITIAAAIQRGLRPEKRPNAYPVRNSIPIAIPFETRNARFASSISAKGIITGRVAEATI